MKFIETSDFTVKYITAPFRHKSYTSLGFTGLIGTDIVDKWGFICDLKVSYITVTLRGINKWLIQRILQLIVIIIAYLCAHIYEIDVRIIEWI